VIAVEPLEDCERPSQRRCVAEAGKRSDNVRLEDGAIRLLVGEPLPDLKRLLNVDVGLIQIPEGAD